MSWIVLLPPIIVLICALISRKVHISLLIGIITASFIAARYAPLKAISIMFTHMFNQIDLSNCYTFAFLFILGMIITLMSHSGGTEAYSRLLKKRINNARSAESASIFLSLCFMIDDFFSSITVGSIMQPLTDSVRVARVKLAYLVDALAAPLVILVPVSSWIAMITAQLNNASISQNLKDNPSILADPFVVYCKVIPFIFYSFITLLSVIFIVRARISFGPMARQEIIAQTTGNLFGGKEPIKKIIEKTESAGTLFDFLLPLISLILSVFIAILYAGDYKLFGGTNTFVHALQNTNIFFALFLGSVISLSISLLYFFWKRKIGLNAIPTIAYASYDTMWESILVLLLAWTFSSLLIKDLHTGDYIANLMIGVVPITFLPAILFILSNIISLSIGSSWGTIAIMVPLAVPLLLTYMGIPTPASPDQMPLLFPLLGAVFAGAVAGDHFSPIAGTTVLSATSSGCYLHDHVTTQLAYAAPVVLATIISFLIAGILTSLPLLLNSFICMISGIGISFVLLYVLNKK